MQNKQGIMRPCWIIMICIWYRQVETLMNQYMNKKHFEQSPLAGHLVIISGIDTHVIVITFWTISSMFQLTLPCKPVFIITIMGCSAYWWHNISRKSYCLHFGSSIIYCHTKVKLFITVALRFSPCPILKQKIKIFISKLYGVSFPLPNVPIQ